MKKLPKKYPVFFVGLFTLRAENLVCKKVEIIGRVIFVHLSKHNIFGITVKTSRFNDNRCETAKESILLECSVSESVNNKSSPEAFL